MMDDRRPVPPQPNGRNTDAEAGGRSRLGRVFGPSWLVALAIVAVLVFALRRYAPLGPIGALLLLTVVWFCVLVVMLRWRMPSPRPEDAGPR